MTIPPNDNWNEPPFPLFYQITPAAAIGYLTSLPFNVQPTLLFHQVWTTVENGVAQILTPEVPSLPQSNNTSCEFVDLVCLEGVNNEGIYFFHSLRHNSTFFFRYTKCSHAWSVKEERFQDIYTCAHCGVTNVYPK